MVKLKKKKPKPRTNYFLCNLLNVWVCFLFSKKIKATLLQAKSLASDFHHMAYCNTNGSHVALSSAMFLNHVPWLCLLVHRKLPYKRQWKALLFQGCMFLMRLDNTTLQRKWKFKINFIMPYTKRIVE